ncbi:hypothetical protein BELL_0077g00010 [Botrytis elliptica]|uniref:Uncharacterized protein n=1 Tax=Botrytis elliptica TaxID=278938 RepID=A0A4Z1JW63_9HELO|nr:hypothetical protein BELL_0077g00010 [Botrytis elliptica]
MRTLPTQPPNPLSVPLITHSLTQPFLPTTHPVHFIPLSSFIPSYKSRKNTKAPDTLVSSRVYYARTPAQIGINAFMLS